MKSFNCHIKKLFVKELTLIFALCIFVSNLHAQSPQSFKYQTILRNLSGQPLANRIVRFQVGIQRGMNGPLVYQEQHSDTTNSQGLAVLEVGRGILINNSPAFSSIRWDSATHFVALSFDSTGNVNFLSMGSFELLSVPYALYALSSGSSTPGPQGPQGIPGPQGPPGNGLSNGTATGQVLYWSGSAWVNLNPGNNNQLLTLCDSIPTWTVNAQCPGTITSLSCSTATHNGTLTSGISASGVSSSIPYTGGNGGPHNVQTITSTGVTGLTATLSTGSFVNGNGSLSYTITGTPAASGTASFAISIGGQNCTLTKSIAPAPAWRPGMVHCGTPTEVVDVINPITGKIWMDRNLGSTRVAISPTDSLAYGDSYQWGRFGDGHQCRNSNHTTLISMTLNPGHGDFIINSNYTHEWKTNIDESPWRGENGINNPCPIGYRIPTYTELYDEQQTWSSSGAFGAYASPLKLTVSGQRNGETADYQMVGSVGLYWGINDVFNCSWDCWFPNLGFSLSGGGAIVNQRSAFSHSIRCIKD
jgi:hypothetical protein